MSAPCLVFIGDVHNRVEMLARAIRAVPNETTRLAFVGDFVNMRHPKLVTAAAVQPEEVLDVHACLIDSLNSIDLTCFYVLGNHDPLDLKGCLGSQWVDLDLQAHAIPGTDFTIGGIGGSHMVPPGLDSRSIRRFAEGIVEGTPSGAYARQGYSEYGVSIGGKPHTVVSRIPKELAVFEEDPPTLLISHTPPLLPLDIPPSMATLQFKSLGLTRAIEAIKPSYIVSGHIHEPQPPFHDLVHGNGFHTACIQTGELSPDAALWAMDFGESRTIPSPRLIKW